MVGRPSWGDPGPSPPGHKAEGGCGGSGVLPCTACTDRARQTVEGGGGAHSQVARYLSVTALRYSM